MKLIVAVSGASGVNLGIKTLKLLPKEIDKYFIMTKKFWYCFRKKRITQQFMTMKIFLQVLHLVHLAQML